MKTTHILGYLSRYNGDVVQYCAIKISVLGTLDKPSWQSYDINSEINHDKKGEIKCRKQT